MAKTKVEEVTQILKDRNSEAESIDWGKIWVATFDGSKVSENEVTEL